MGGGPFCSPTRRACGRRSGPGSELSPCLPHCWGGGGKRAAVPRAGVRPALISGGRCTGGRDAPFFSPPCAVRLHSLGAPHPWWWSRVLPISSWTPALILTCARQGFHPADPPPHLSLSHTCSPKPRAPQTPSWSPQVMSCPLFWCVQPIGLAAWILPEPAWALPRTSSRSPRSRP